MSHISREVAMHLLLSLTVCTTTNGFGISPLPGVYPHHAQHELPGKAQRQWHLRGDDAICSMTVTPSLCGAEAAAVAREALRC